MTFCKVTDEYSTKWFEEVVMNYFPISKKPVVLVPCTKTKPHQKSIRKTLPKIVSLHEAKELSIVIVSDLLTLIPFDNENYEYDYPPQQLTENEIKVLRERLYLWFKNNLLGEGRPHSLFGALHPQHQEIVIPPLLKVGKTFSGLLIVRNFCWSMADDILTEWRIRNRNIEENVVARVEEKLPCKYSTILEQILNWVKEKGNICDKDLKDKFFAPYFLEQGTVPLNWYTEGYKICKVPYLIKEGDKRVFNPEIMKEARSMEFKFTYGGKKFDAEMVSKDLRKEFDQVISEEIATDPFFEELQKVLEKSSGSIKVVLDFGNEKDVSLFEGVFERSSMKIVKREPVSGVCKIRRTSNEELDSTYTIYEIEKRQ